MDEQIIFMSKVGSTESGIDWSTRAQEAILLAIQRELYNDLRAIATLSCLNKRLTIALQCKLLGSMPILVRLDSVDGAAQVHNAQRFAYWLAANCPIVKSLDIGFKAATIKVVVPAQQATAVLAGAVATSVKASPDLPLQHVVLNELANEPELLRQLSHCKSLTHLKMMLPNSAFRSSSADETIHVSPAVPKSECLVPALKGLSQLHSLSLHSRWSGDESSTESLLPALHTLHNLTFLSIDEPRRLATLEQLPEQLLHLELTATPMKPLRFQAASGLSADGRPPMILTHLTALTAITFGKPYAPGGQTGDSGHMTHQTASSSVDISTAFSDMEGSVPEFMHLITADQLPPALQYLTIGVIVSPQPLQQLQQLRHLEVREPNLDQPILQLIAKQCQQLTSLMLTYDNATCAVLERASTAWPSLPLTTLCLERFTFSTALFQQLVCIETLMTLQLKVNQTVVSDQDVELLPFAALPLQWTRLHKLVISGMPDSGLLPARGLRIPPYTRALGLLPSVVKVLAGPKHDAYQRAVSVQQKICQKWCLSVATCKQLHCFSFTPSSAIEIEDFRLDFNALTGATQLTALQLKGVGLQDSALVPLACNLTGLEELDVSYNRLLSSRSFMSIARSLHQLTYLDLRNTGVNKLTATWASRRVALPTSCVLQVSKPDKVTELSPNITFGLWNGGLCDD